MCSGFDVDGALLSDGENMKKRKAMKPTTPRKKVMGLRRREREAYGMMGGRRSGLPVVSSRTWRILRAGRPARERLRMRCSERRTILLHWGARVDAERRSEALVEICQSVSRTSVFL